MNPWSGANVSILPDSGEASGLGGPARWFARDFGCRVTGRYRATDRQVIARARRHQCFDLQRGFQAATVELVVGRELFKCQPFGISAVRLQGGEQAIAAWAFR
jgi:hypothetical protein